MAKLRKNYSLDESVVKKLDELAARQGLSNSAYLTILINKAAEDQKSLSVKGAE